jgi:hypothetical protein
MNNLACSRSMLGALPQLKAAYTYTISPRQLTPFQATNGHVRHLSYCCCETCSFVRRGRLSVSLGLTRPVKYVAQSKRELGQGSQALGPMSRTVASLLEKINR